MQGPTRHALYGAFKPAGSVTEETGAGPGRLPTTGDRCGMSPDLDQRLAIHVEWGQRAGPVERPDRHVLSHLPVSAAAAVRVGQSPVLGEEQEVGG